MDNIKADTAVAPRKDVVMGISEQAARRFRRRLGVGLGSWVGRVLSTVLTGSPPLQFYL